VVFAEATWLLPSTDVGFVEMQASVNLPLACANRQYLLWFLKRSWHLDVQLQIGSPLLSNATSTLFGLSSK
jgi:hypothetical protein